MKAFATRHKQFIRNSHKSEDYFGFELRSLAKLEPGLKFLYEDWWKVEFKNLDSIPNEGPALIVGNSTGIVPWTALMLIYALMTRENPRRVHVVCDLDWIEDERIHHFLRELGFVPWSSDNVKRLLAKGEVVATFPEGIASTQKTFSQRYRLGDFDWTRLLSAVEEGVKIVPLATIGLDEAVPVLFNADKMAKLLNMPAFPVTPFFPFYPFPVNLFSLPVKWKMAFLAPSQYKKETNRDKVEEQAKTQARYLEGEIQAEINRMLRARTHTFAR